MKVKVTVKTRVKDVGKGKGKVKDEVDMSVELIGRILLKCSISTKVYKTGGRNIEEHIITECQG